MGYACILPIDSTEAAAKLENGDKSMNSHCNSSKLASKIHFLLILIPNLGGPESLWQLNERKAMQILFLSPDKTQAS